MNDAAARSDAPATTQKEAEEAEDRFINSVLIFKATKSAIKQGKSNERQPRNPGQYKVSDTAKKCIEGYVKYLENISKAPGTISQYQE